ncbi:long-chain acyl-CoA synthetase [Diaminobutyricimonas aerilata]|uniref:Long-chain acyl-CoA synthetase n=1 Tax=Diaminobutyricimonas aerilata TaxID=1162967 RepID=A0A2M9CFC9_9MICO|nr:long-chain-fatty-acid--CoA ligase [Diaminobutyricimonas aerilata]PJJ70631.1 long-chain acyl-CoA synthetase [Diaminobutyricimonas aerilata]
MDEPHDTLSDPERPWLQHYAPGVPADIPDVDHTLVDVLDRSCRAHRERTALEFFGRVMSYGALEQQVAQAAEGLRRLGVSAGDRVAIILPNSPQNVVAFYAVLRLGAIAVQHNPLYTAPELRHQFEDHGARVVVAWTKVVDTVLGFADAVGIEAIIAADIVDAMPLGKRIALRLPIAKARQARSALGASVPRHPLVHDWRRLHVHGRLDAAHPRPSVDDTALIQYTSGTTGAAKGAVLSHANLVANTMQGRAWLPGLREGDEVFYGVLPLFHAYGLTLNLTFAISVGARLVLFPTPDVGLIVSAARRTPPSFIPAVPPLYERIAAAAEKGDIDVSGVRYAISGAMSLPVSTVERWEAVSGGYLVEGYGMTETSPVALGNPVGPTRRPGTVGVPFPSTRIRLIDPEHPDRELAPGERGELLISGPQVFQGYWGNDEATAAALLPERWLRTGDIAEVSDDGFVRIVDRLKELVITGGFNVAPSEVEQALREHPDVLDAAVVGLPRTSGGEDVAASIVLRVGRNSTVEAVREFVRTRLTPYKVPRRIDIVLELPRNLVGKVLRREVRQRMLDRDS